MGDLIYCVKRVVRENGFSSSIIQTGSSDEVFASCRLPKKYYVTDLSEYMGSYAHSMAMNTQIRTTCIYCRINMRTSVAVERTDSDI